MDKQNIVVTYNPTSEEKALFLEVLGGAASLTFLTEIPPAQREQSLENATALLSWNFPREILPQEYSKLQHVSLIQLITAGADYMPFADLPAHMSIASNAGAYAIPMAEHNLAMTLALAKRLLIEHQKLRNGVFDDIGTLHDLEHVLRSCDVVVLSLPLIRATQGLIGKNELAWMKPDAILVNSARGAIIDEEALYIHAKNHPTFMVGIDTWWEEPLRGGTFRMGYPFLELPNVLGSPHNSALDAQVISVAARQAAENIRRFLKGERMMGIVRREDYL